MTEKKMPIPGQKVGPPTEEELKAERQRAIDEKLKIIKDLNSIAFPISATVFTHGQTWTIRNKAFWKQLQGKDDHVQKFLLDYLSEQK